MGFYCIFHFFVGWLQTAILLFFAFVFYFSSYDWCILTTYRSKSLNRIHRIMFFSRLVISALKTTVLKWEMLLELMSCVSVAFIQKTYENDSVCEITQCRQSLCHVTVHWRETQGENVVL